jgi:hypothetical protein
MCVRDGGSQAKLRGRGSLYTLLFAVSNAHSFEVARFAQTLCHRESGGDDGGRSPPWRTEYSKSEFR